MCGCVCVGGWVQIYSNGYSMFRLKAKAARRRLDCLLRFSSFPQVPYGAADKLEKIFREM